MLLNNDIMAEGKAETRSLASGLRRKERIEHLFLHFGGDSGAIVADESAPKLPVGEGSIALAQALGINANPRTGGKDGDVAYLIYPGSGNGRPRPLKEIVAKAKELFEAWGGFDRLNACLADD